MDFRGLIRSASQVETAKRLALRGLLNYQPFIFDDGLAVGSGLSVAAGFTHNPPSIYCPNAIALAATNEFAATALAKPEQRAEFFAANDRMRRYYDSMVEQIVAGVGSLSGRSVLDVGCNSGYFPVAFARRGAARVAGLDRVDYSETIALINDICGVNIEFRTWSYDGSINAPEQFDLVTSIAVLVHLSDPLHHLAWLGSSARKALFVFTPVHADDDYSVRFHTVNRYYTDRFPYCFDITTISRKLLRLAFEQMGFTKVIEFQMPDNCMPPQWGRDHLGLLGIRETDAGGPAARTTIQAS